MPADSACSCANAPSLRGCAPHYRPAPPCARAEHRPAPLLLNRRERGEGAAPGRALVAHAEPAVALIVAVEGLGRERVRKREEVRALAALRLQRELAVEELVVQHRLHALAGHVPARAPEQAIAYHPPPISCALAAAGPLSSLFSPSFQSPQ